ncbi:MAG TPA: archease [Candidatus Nanoarchaeia archaeon]|nr:archease [Candidatus Nanoarchaeia archaeon]
MTGKRTFIDHTADILFEAQGSTIEELFEQCGLAVEETQVELSTVKPAIKKVFHLENAKVDALLFDFLDDLLFYKDAEQLLFSKFVLKLDKPQGNSPNFRLEVQAYGQKIDVKKHGLKVDIKAITMHMFEVKKTAKGWKAKVLVDI